MSMHMQRSPTKTSDNKNTIHALAATSRSAFRHISAAGLLWDRLQTPEGALGLASTSWESDANQDVHTVV